MPVVAIFFPLEIAIAMTAVVHLTNNMFKVVLIGRQAVPLVLSRFGVPAVLCAFLGAMVLGWLSEMPAIFEYAAFGHHMQISPVKLIVGSLILVFVGFELSKCFAGIELDKKYLPYGGAISGFFGGLSGHQGAFRSMFLLKAGLSKEQFVATGVMLAIMVDVSRMTIYGWGMFRQSQGVDWLLVVAASVSAFVGAYFGARLLKKLTIKAIQMAVSILLVVVSFGLISGVL